MHERGPRRRGRLCDRRECGQDGAPPETIHSTAIDRRALGPVQATRAVREYLEGIEADGRPEMRKSISVTDPAEWTCAPGGPAFFAYSTNYLMYSSVSLLISKLRAHRTKEVDATRTMIDQWRSAPSNPRV